MFNRKKLTPKEIKEADYVFRHKRTGEEYGTCSKKLAKPIQESPSWETVKEPKKPGRPKQQ